MTYMTIHHAVHNDDLQKRVTAAVLKEAWANPTFGNTQYGQQVRRLPPQGDSMPYFMWPVAIAKEADYEYAYNVRMSNPNDMQLIEDIGKDPGVISDADILDAVQTNWPPDPPPVTPTGGGATLTMG